MSRVLAFQSPPGKAVLRGQAHFWAVMRSLDLVGPWTLTHVLAGSNADRSTLREYVRRLLAGGFVERVAFDDLPEQRPPEQHYRIGRQQLSPPVVRRDGSVGLQGRGQQQMWNVIRGPIARGGFTFKDVALYASTDTVSVSRVSASRYVGHLAQAGYLAPLQAGRPRRPAVWRLKPAMNTGPKPPLILQAHVVFDQTVEVAETMPKPGERRWYPRVPGAIRLRDGSSYPVEHYRHSDPTVEALRWQICEGQLIQAIGRLRPLRRGPNEAFFLDIVSDVPLPITVDRVEEWNAVRLGAWADMAAEGVILTAASDIQAAFPDLAPSAKAAQNMSEAVRLTLRSNIESYIDLGVNVSLIEVKRAGRYAPTEIAVLPNGPKGPNALKRQLSERGLGSIERITVTRAGKAWARPSFERVGRLVGERMHAWAAVFAAASASESESNRSASEA